MKTRRLILRLLFVLSWATCGCFAVEIDFGKDEGLFRLTNGAEIARQGSSPGRPVLRLDTRQRGDGWVSCFTTQPGLLTNHGKYTLTLRYRNHEFADDSLLHLVVRDPGQGDPSTLARLDIPEFGGPRERTLRVKIPAQGDFRVILFMKNRGLSEIEALTIADGDGLRLQAAVAGARPVEAPRPAAPAEFFIERPASGKGGSISVADFGATPRGPSNFAAFNQAALACRERGASRFLIPPGRWILESESETWNLIGLSNVVLDGQGAELIFFRNLSRGGKGLISMASCDHLAVVNLKLDWDWQRMPLASFVSIEGAAKDGAWVDARFEEPPPSPGQALLPRVFEALDPKRLLVGDEGSADLWGSFEDRLEWREGKIGRYFAVPGPWARAQVAALAAGQHFRVRHFIYDMGCLNMNHVTHLLLSNVDLYSCPGMGMRLMGESHHVELNRVRIAPRPGERRPISATADHFHVNESQGYLKFEDCEFGFGGDDCINIHDGNFHGVRLGSNLFEGRFFRDWATPVKAGDLLEFRGDDFAPTGFSASVRSITLDARKQTASITLSRNFPGELPSLLVCFNRRFGSDHYIIRHCVFGRNCGSGFRLQSGSGLVEDNFFDHTQGPAIRLETGWATRGWSEGYGISNLLIRGNTFADCNPVLYEEFGPVIHMGTFRQNTRSPDFKSAYPIFREITIDSNAFVRCPGAAITISSAGRVSVQRNAFSGAWARAKEHDQRSAVVVSHAAQVEVKNNTWERSPAPARLGALWDAPSCEAPVFEGNRLR